MGTTQCFGDILVSCLGDNSPSWGHLSVLRTPQHLGDISLGTAQCFGAISRLWRDLGILGIPQRLGNISVIWGHLSILGPSQHLENISGSWGHLSTLGPPQHLTISSGAPPVSTWSMRWQWRPPFSTSSALHDQLHPNPSEMSLPPSPRGHHPWWPLPFGSSTSPVAPPSHRTLQPMRRGQEPPDPCPHPFHRPLPRHPPVR